jgi:hypothetical protein
MEYPFPLASSALAWAYNEPGWCPAVERDQVRAAAAKARARMPPGNTPLII